MHARLEHKQPHHQTNQHIQPQVHDPYPIHSKQHHNARPRCQKHGHRHLRRVEHRNNHNRAQIIHDRDRRQKHLQRHRHSLAQQRQNTQCKGNVSRRRNRPATQGCCITPVDRAVDQRWHQHAAQSRTRWQHGLAERGQLALQQLSFDLQPHQKEENCHPQVVDPHQQRLGQHQPIAPNTNFTANLQQLLVPVAPRRVADNHR